MKYEEYAAFIAARLKDIRIRNHYTQAEVAKMLHMGGKEPDYGKKAYAAYEQGRNVPPLDKLLALCEIYNMSPNTILGYEDTARLNVLCDRYNITYETIDGYSVKINEYVVPKHIFFEIMFKAERMINNVVSDFEYLQKLREYETNMVKDFIDHEIYSEGKPYSEKSFVKMTDAEYKALKAYTDNLIQSQLSNSQPDKSLKDIMIKEFKKRESPKGGKKQ